MKTYGITITRKVKELYEDKNGNIKERIVSKEFPCRVNAAIPKNHKMLR